MDMELVCKGCGIKFSVPYRENRIDTIKYCSHVCYSSTMQKQINCMECGVEFTVPKSSPRKFCADACYQKHRKAQKISKVCEVCSNEFETTSTRKDTARFCSKKCMDQDSSWKEAISAAMSKENHWRWKGGKSKEISAAYNRRTYRASFTQHMLSLAPDHPFLIKKDGMTILDPKIHVHHIDRNPLNDSLDNLLAVTVDAHARIHHNGTKPRPWECWPPNPERW